MNCFEIFDRHTKVFGWIGMMVSTVCFLINITVFVIMDNGKLPHKFKVYTLIGGSVVMYIASFVCSAAVICTKDESRQNRDPRIVRSESTEIPIASQSSRENRNLTDNGFEVHLPNCLSTIPLKQSTRKSPPIYVNHVLESDIEQSSTDEEHPHQIARRSEDRQSVGRHLYPERNVKNQLIESREADGFRMKHLTLQNIIPTVVSGRQQMTTSFIGEVLPQNRTPETYRRASEQNIPDLVTELVLHDRNSARTCSNWSSASSLAIPQQRSDTTINIANQDLKTRSCSMIHQQNVPSRSPSKALQERIKSQRSTEDGSEYPDASRKFRIGATTDSAARSSKINFTDAEHTRETSRNIFNVRAPYPTPRDVPKTRKSPVKFTPKLSTDPSGSIHSSGQRNMTDMHHDHETTESTQFDVLGIPEISPTITRTSPTPPRMPDCQSSPAFIKKFKSSDGSPVTSSEESYHELSPQKWLLAWKLGTQGVQSADAARVLGVRI